MELIFLFLPILISLILSLKLLLIPKHKTNSSKILGFFFLCLCVALFAILFQYIRKFEPELNQYFYIFEVLFYTVMLALPAVIFFYVISLTDYMNNYKTVWKILPHFYIPIQALFFNVYTLVFILPNEPTITKTLDFTNFFSLKITFILLNIIYITAALYVYKNHHVKIKEVYSFEKGISFNWISIFIAGYILFVGCFFLLSPNSSPYVVYLPLLLIITYLLFQRNTQTNTSLLNNETEVEIQEHRLDDEKKKVVINAITTFMKNEKPYLKSDLTLFQLAKMLNTNSSYLSVLINKDFNSSFVSFINTYRIIDAKKTLIDSNYKDYTIEAISEEVGFNSKSAFNRAFKKITQQTPSEYRKEQN